MELNETNGRQAVYKLMTVSENPTINSLQDFAVALGLNLVDLLSIPTDRQNKKV